MTLILCHGGMYSGKSDFAISRVQSYLKEGLKGVLYQPEKNTRDIFHGKPVWFSRAGGDEITLLSANFFESPKQVLENIDKYDVFGFEEWQMYSADVFEVIEELHESKKIVVAAGLDYYFNGEPVELFDKLRNLKEAILFPGISARCQDCQDGGKRIMALRTQRTHFGVPENFDAAKIVAEGISGYDYKPVCLKHWKVNPPSNPDLFPDYERFYLKHVKNDTK